MKVYFDMDGVISDLYGALSRAWGIPPEKITGHSPDTARMYFSWILEPPGAEEVFATLPPLHLEEVRALMIELVASGHQLGILTSLGVQPDFDHGHAIRAGKERWLQRHYGDFIENGILGELHFVETGSHKKFFASGDSLLIDDTLHIIDDFIEAGGKAVHYKSWNSEESMGEIREIAVKVDV